MRGRDESRLKRRVLKKRNRRDAQVYWTTEARRVDNARVALPRFVEWSKDYSSFPRTYRQRMRRHLEWWVARNQPFTQ